MYRYVKLKKQKRILSEKAGNFAAACQKNTFVFKFIKTYYFNNKFR